MATSPDFLPASFPPPPGRVVVALSGGVDSSVAAGLLVEAGYQVIGLMMHLWAETGPGWTHDNRCCTPQGVEDARRVCQILAIPFYLVNEEALFRQAVVEPFIAGYAAGQTPNPCLNCNRSVKFGALLDQAMKLGAVAYATGHYARIHRDNRGYHLLKGVDQDKDQSYVLYMLGQAELARVIFPLGHLTKEQVRAHARRLGLPVAEKEESQEICFLPEDDYRPFLLRHAPTAFIPGPILDQTGRVVGRHQGLPLYTIGQRKGLDLAVTEPNQSPRYVIGMDAWRHALIVGPESALYSTRLEVEQVSYVAGVPPAGPLAITAKIRYKAAAAAATLIPLPDQNSQRRAEVLFQIPQRAVTPGQGIVFYQEEEVIGGGVISRSLT